MKKQNELKTHKLTIENTKSSRGEKIMTRMIIQNGITRSLGASLVVLALVATPITVADAATPFSIDNTATVNGTDPASNPVTDDSLPVEVDLENTNNVLTITKSVDFAVATSDDADNEGDEGEDVVYTYTVTNGGNTTLTGVSINDTHEGTGTFTAPAFDSWTTQAGSPAASGSSITMAPGAVAVFTTTYTITAADINTLGGTSTLSLDNDGNLDNSAHAEGSFGATFVSSVTPGTASVPLDADASLDVLKLAYEGTPIPGDIAGSGLGSLTAAGTERPEGTLITYVYTVTNNGDVPVTTVGLTDAHVAQGTLGTITYNSLANTSGNSVYTAGNTVDILYPGDVAYFTATYTILQADIDAQ
jgi:uncharacterized repeat protein (TIGR01451 family)